MTIQEIEQQIIEEFAIFDNWLDKYEYIIDLGKNLEPIAEEEKVEENLIKGCQSRVWLVCEERGTEGEERGTEGAENKEDGGNKKLLHFRADSDAIITKGIISLLIRVFDNQTPQDILNANLQFIEAIGLKENLSPTRANGLVSMLSRIRLYAAEHCNQ